MTNQQTGEPVKARVIFLPHKANPRVKEYPALSRLKGRFIVGGARQVGEPRLGGQTEDGNYQIPAIAGKGFLIVMATNNEYATGVGIERIPADLFQSDLGMRMLNAVGFVDPHSCHVIQMVELDDSPESTVDLQVHPGHTMVAKMRDAQGDPLSGVSVQRRRPLRMAVDSPLQTDRTKIVGVTRPRSVLFFHPEKKLAAYLLANTDQRDVEVELVACATIKGRLVDEAGRPKSNRFLTMRPSGQKLDEHDIQLGVTDEDGRFEVPTFIANTAFDIVNRGRKETVVKANVRLKPGEILDLGDLQK